MNQPFVSFWHFRTLSSIPSIWSLAMPWYWSRLFEIIPFTLACIQVWIKISVKTPLQMAHGDSAARGTKSAAYFKAGWCYLLTLWSGGRESRWVAKPSDKMCSNCNIRIQLLTAKKPQERKPKENTKPKRPNNNKTHHRNKGRHVANSTNAPFPTQERWGERDLRSAGS